MRLADKKKVALVLSGGGVKAAAFHLGVCLALRDKGFVFAGGSRSDPSLQVCYPERTIRLYVGSSAGAVIGTFLAAGFSVESIIEAFEKGSSSDMRKWRKNDSPESGRLKPLSYRDLFSLNSSSLFGVVPNVLKRRSMLTGGLEALIKSGFKVNGLFNTHGIERYMRKHVWPSNRFDTLGVELFIIATQLNHSRKVVFGAFNETTKVKTIKYANYALVSEAVAASASLPPVFAPFSIRNQKGKEIYFFDGEIRDTLSTHVAADYGADLVISSYSIQPYHYTKEFGSLHRYGIPMIFNQALYQTVEQKIQRHREGQNQIRSIINAVNGYFQQVNLPDEHRQKLLDIITERVNYKANVDYLYIHPSPSDHEMFFFDHFSLNPAILSRIMQIGYKAAVGQLRKHDLLS